MLTKVTKDHIGQGMRKSSSLCPISLSLLDETGITYYVGVCGIFEADGELLMDLTAEMRQFINRFDDGELVEPFSFERPEPKNAKD